MIRLIFPADPDLKPYYSHHLIVEMDVAEGNFLCSFPDAICVMSIFFSDDLPQFFFRNQIFKNNRGFVCGLLKDGMRIFSPGHFKCVLTYFTPLGAYRMFGVPPAEYLNSIIPLDCFAGIHANWLMEKIYLSENHAQRISIINNFCRKRLNNKTEDHCLFKAICLKIGRRNGNIKIGELTDAFDLSTRYIDRLFDRYCGITPKQYTRLIRLGSASNLLISGLYDIQDVVYKLGYYDQAHLSHDFATYGDITPGELLKGSSKTIFQKVLSYPANQPEVINHL